MNEINTWRQGAFVDGPRYARMPTEWKEERRHEEQFLVRPYPTGNAICTAANPAIAEWIASRLNLASDLERLTYEFATGKSDGDALIKYVRSRTS